MGDPWTTALGALFMAAFAAGLWMGVRSLLARRRKDAMSSGSRSPSTPRDAQSTDDTSPLSSTSPDSSTPRRGDATGFRRPRAPESLPFPQVSFEFIVLSLQGDPVAEDEFYHRLLMSPGGRRLSRDARLLLDRNTLSLTCRQRTFVRGRVKSEPAEFQTCRRLANRPQTTMAPSDYDVIALGRGAFRLCYDGPPVSEGAHLELMIQAVKTILSLRPGVVFDRAALLAWGRDAWGMMHKRKRGMELRDHFKVEVGQSVSGVALATRGLSKFGLPDMRVDGLPRDMTGIAATCLTSISIDLIQAESALNPARGLALPAVAGTLGFAYQAPTRQSRDEAPTGVFRLLGGVDGAEPTLLGMLEVLSRLRQKMEDGTDFWNTGPSDLGALREVAQKALPRLKSKFVQGREQAGRVFLIRCQPKSHEDQVAEQWISLQDWDGSTIHGALAVGPIGGQSKLGSHTKIEESDILDWMILQGGDVEDGGFGLRMSNQAGGPA